MRQRGRKSSSRLSVVPINCEAYRPSPPSNLTPPQAELWERIVADSPAGWFHDGDTLLTLFCRHAVSGDFLSKLIDAEPRQPPDLKRLNRLLTMRARETQLTTHLLTKMRLTQQSQMHPRTAGCAMARETGLKLWQRKPWEDN